ncbi:MAG: RNA 2',3'-cyclic phosphodiesterase [Fimbriimonadales bacterium]|nr:RNA 2',3'-cyclic phosphodiesterase [Fimbriimonadales bacterium]
MRLFAASFPPPNVLEAIRPVSQRAHRDIPQKGAWVAQDRLHITLRFFGETLPQEQCIEVCDEALNCIQPFELRLVRISGFPSSRLKRVLFLEPEECDTFQLLLQRFDDTNEENRHPHLTIARFNQPVELPRIKFDPIEWRVEGALLVNSLQFGAERRYVTVKEWSFV